MRHTRAEHRSSGRTSGPRPDVAASSSCSGVHSAGRACTAATSAGHIASAITRSPTASPSRSRRYVDQAGRSVWDWLADARRAAGPRCRTIRHQRASAARSSGSGWSTFTALSTSEPTSIPAAWRAPRRSDRRANSASDRTSSGRSSVRCLVGAVNTEHRLCPAVQVPLVAESSTIPTALGRSDDRRPRARRRRLARPRGLREARRPRPR